MVRVNVLRLRRRGIAIENKRGHGYKLKREIPK
jgi:biotin operon repressor